ncbi:MAG: diguanylate cyclase [Desulfobacterales bacterium]|nr:diguanylate cyclase [Desulfobacterales bacterium]
MNSEKTRFKKVKSDDLTKILNAFKAIHVRFNEFLNALASKKTNEHTVFTFDKNAVCQAAALLFVEFKKYVPMSDDIQNQFDIWLRDYLLAGQKPIDEMVTANEESGDSNLLLKMFGTLEQIEAEKNIHQLSVLRTIKHFADKEEMSDDDRVLSIKQIYLKYFGPLDQIRQVIFSNLRNRLKVKGVKSIIKKMDLEAPSYDNIVNEIQERVDKTTDDIDTTEKKVDLIATSLIHNETQEKEDNLFKIHEMVNPSVDPYSLLYPSEANQFNDSQHSTESDFVNTTSNAAWEGDAESISIDVDPSLNELLGGASIEPIPPKEDIQPSKQIRKKETAEIPEHDEIVTLKEKINTLETQLKFFEKLEESMNELRDQYLIIEQQYDDLQIEEELLKNEIVNDTNMFITNIERFAHDTIKKIQSDLSKNELIHEINNLMLYFSVEVSDERRNENRKKRKKELLAEKVNAEEDKLFEINNNNTYTLEVFDQVLNQVQDMNTIRNRLTQVQMFRAKPFKALVDKELSEYNDQLSLWIREKKKTLHQQQEDQILKYKDKLTGLPNYIAFRERCRYLTNDSIQNKKGISIALLQLDHFTNRCNPEFINKAFISVAQTVQHVIKTKYEHTSIYCTYEEKKILVATQFDVQQTQNITDQIKEALKPKKIPQIDEQLTLSVCITHFIPSSKLTPQQMNAWIDEVDALMVSTVHLGRNRTYIAKKNKK